MSKYKITGISYVHIGKRERWRGRETDRERDKKTDRQTDGERQRQRQRQSLTLNSETIQTKKEKRKKKKKSQLFLVCVYFAFKLSKITQDYLLGDCIIVLKLQTEIPPTALKTGPHIAIFCPAGAFIVHYTDVHFPKLHNHIGLTIFLP